MLSDLPNASCISETLAQSPASQYVKARTPDESLAIQEEPEEDDADEQNDEQEVRDPGRQHLATAFLHPRRIVFPKAMIPSTTRVTSAAAVTIFLKSNERTRMKGSRSTMAVMTRRSTRKILIALDPRTRRVIRHGLSPRAYL